MDILKFPIERTPAGRVVLLTKQVEILLAEKRVVGSLLDHLDQLAEARRLLGKSDSNRFRRDQVQPAFNVGRVW